MQTYSHDAETHSTYEKVNEFKSKEKYKSVHTKHTP